MGYQVLKMGQGRLNGKPTVSLTGGKVKRITIFNDTYILMKDRIPMKKDFPAIQILVDPEQKQKFVIRPAFIGTPNAVSFKRNKETSIRFGCTDLLKHLGWRKSGKIRLVGHWIHNLGPGALEFDIRKPQ